MIYTFFQHELKAFWRSKSTGKSVAIRIFMGILIVYLLGNALVIGFFMDVVLRKKLPHDNIIVAFCGIILIYYLFELLMRLQLQELPTLRVQPYLQLPIKRNTIVGYLALTGLLSVFNLWPVILFFPFILKVIGHSSGVIPAVSFMIAIIGITVFNNYLALYIKRKSNLNGWVFLIVLAVLICIIGGDFYWHLYSIRETSYLFFGNLISHPALCLLPVLLGVTMYCFNFFYLKQNLYLEELNARKESYKNSTEFPLLNRFGPPGDLVANEIKLILRNKRPRSALIMSVFFLFYGLFFYKNAGMNHNDAFKIFAGMFMTGFFIVNYGKFVYSWQASHFDGLLVSRSNFRDLIRSKYILFTMATTMAFILTIPYVYFGWHTLAIHFAMFLWNVGVNSTLLLYFGNRDAKRIDLSKSASFNWEGVGATQLLSSIPLIVGPLIIYIPFKLLNHADLGLEVIAITGLIFWVTRSFWINKLLADFYSKKYTLAEGFRIK